MEDFSSTRRSRSCLRSSRKLIARVSASVSSVTLIFVLEQDIRFDRRFRAFFYDKGLDIDSKFSEEFQKAFLDEFERYFKANEAKKKRILRHMKRMFNQEMARLRDEQGK